LDSQFKSGNPVAQAIVRGTAPQPARLAAARGLLPLPQNDLLEVLVALRESDDNEISEAAVSTLASQTKEELLIAARDEDTSPAVLGFLATCAGGGRELREAVILNRQTPDPAIAAFAAVTSDGSLLELIAVNQQRLIRSAEIINAILANASRTSEAERHARETHREFYEKEGGVRQIAEELRARGKTAAAEFFESADMTGAAGELSLDDAWILAQHIEVSDSELDDSWLPLERYEEIVTETPQEMAANIQRLLESEKLETGDVSPERVMLIRRIMFMNAKDRMKLAMKGDREARGILIRDSNRVVATAVIKNPRIMDQEVENIAAMRTVAAEVLRLIALNRAWTRSYPIIHNLARNPRTPIPAAMGILPRIQTKDLKNLSQNRNVSQTVRRQATRLCEARAGG
jgi:regulator of extracellular matrix RemA (YlzA/DUF370 family)